MISRSCEIKSNRFPQLQVSGRRRATQAAIRAGYAVKRYAAPVTPVKTGALRTNVDVVVNDRAGTASAIWRMPYAGYQNDGTRRGITPKRFKEYGMRMAQPQFEADCAGIYGTGV